MVIKTVDTASPREATACIVKILDSTYESNNLEKVAFSTTKLNTERRKLLLGLPNELEGLFDGTLVIWYTVPRDLYINQKYRPFNGR